MKLEERVEIPTVSMVPNTPLLKQSSISIVGDGHGRIGW
jgi:hypothetical protein